MALSLIVAVSQNGVIGRDGDLPWRLSSDLKRFKKLTMGHCLIMGRVTWESIGRPLPGRQSIVISRQSLSLPEGVHLAPSIEDALKIAAEDDEPFVIGGAQIYALAWPLVSRIYLTEVLADVAGDAHLPDWDLSTFNEVDCQQHEASEKDEFPHRFRVLRREGENHEGREEHEGPVGP